MARKSLPKQARNYRPPKDASAQMQRRLADAGWVDKSIEQQQADTASKKKLIDKLSGKELFEALTRQEFSAESLVDSLLRFFRLDMQPRWLRHEKEELLSKKWAGVANVKGLPQRVRTIANDIEKASESQLLNLSAEPGQPFPNLFSEARPADLSDPMPESLRQLPTLLSEYAAFVERTIKRETERLTRYAEEWRAQADEVIWNLVEASKKQTGQKMFAGIAQLLTDAAAILDLRDDKQGGKIFGTEELKQRYYRHASNTPLG